METLEIIGIKKSSLLFKKIDIFNDRIEAKDWPLPKKTILLNEITSWTEINRKIKNTNIVWQELTIYADKTKYAIESRCWQNYSEMKDFLVKGKVRDTEKEKKIYDSFW